MIQPGPGKKLLIWIVVNAIRLPSLSSMYSDEIHPNMHEPALRLHFLLLLVLKLWLGHVKGFLLFSTKYHFYTNNARRNCYICFSTNGLWNQRNIFQYNHSTGYQVMKLLIQFSCFLSCPFPRWIYDSYPQNLGIFFQKSCSKQSLVVFLNF